MRWEGAGSGEWIVGSGEWRVESGEWRELQTPPDCGPGGRLRGILLKPIKTLAKRPHPRPVRFVALNVTECVYLVLAITYRLDVRAALPKLPGEAAFTKIVIRGRKSVV